MSLPWRRLLALLLVASSCRGAPESHEGGSLPLAAQQPWLPPLPPCRDALGSLACTLAGGWCPAHEAGLQHSRCSDGSGGCSNGTSNGSSNGTQPGPQQHKPLRPLDRTDWLGLGTAAVALLLAATGGTGGGAILVPIYLMVLGFSTAGAVALSNVTIVGGTLANLAFNTARAHPLHPERPLIDWNLVMVMEPSTILGAVAGGYVNKVLPAWLTTVTLCLLLLFVTYKMMHKAVDIRFKERRALKESLRRLSAVDAEGGDLLDHIPTPLLQPLLHLDSSDSEGSPTPTGASRAPSLPAPLADRLNSSSSSGSGGGFEGGAGGAVVLLRQPADSATSEVHVDLEAGAQLPDGGSAPAPIQRAVSEPMPIGQAGSHALPMLTPIIDHQETQLGSGQQQQLLVLASPSPHPPGSPLSPGAKGGLHSSSSGGSLAGPYKDGSQWSSWKGGSSGQVPRRRRWRPHVPWGKLTTLLLLLAGVVGFDILKSLAPCPSLSYWLRATAMVPVTLLTLLGVRSYLLRKDRAQRAAGYQPLEGDVQWTSRSTLLYPALCTFAGLCAGVFGVGGGIIKGPLMLEMGVLPEVAAATSATMIWFTSCSASVVFISFGAVQWDYAAACFALGLLSTIAGQLLMLWVSRHLRSRSLLVFVMAAVLGLSCLALAAQGWQATLEAARSGKLLQFHDVCGRAAL